MEEKGHHLDLIASYGKAITKASSTDILDITAMIRLVKTLKTLLELIKDDFEENNNEQKQKHS